MTNVQSIFGLESNQPFTPQLIDIKFIYDQREILKTRTQRAVVKCKTLKNRMANSRDIMERRHLMIEIESCKKEVGWCLDIFRKVNKEACDIEDIYLSNLEKHTENRYKQTA